MNVRESRNVRCSHCSVTINLCRKVPAAILLLDARHMSDITRAKGFIDFLFVMIVSNILIIISNIGPEEDCRAICREVWYEHYMHTCVCVCARLCTCVLLRARAKKKRKEKTQPREKQISYFLVFHSFCIIMWWLYHMEWVGCPGLDGCVENERDIKIKRRGTPGEHVDGMKVMYDRNVPIILSRTLDDSIGVLNAFRSCLLNSVW